MNTGIFETVTTGAANDIEKATSIAQSMVTRYGMSKRFGLAGFATVESQYLEGRTALNCSDKTAAEIDEEVVAILKESYAKALELLRENRELMDKLADFLIEKETITGKEFMQIFRKEKGIPEPEKEEKKAEEDTAEEKIAEDTVEAETVSTIDVRIGDEVAETEAQETEEQETEEQVPENKDEDDRPKGLFSRGTIE